MAAKRVLRATSLDENRIRLQLRSARAVVAVRLLYVSIESRVARGRGLMNAMRFFSLVAAAVLSTAAHAQYTDGVVKIGLLTDMSGLYADGSGLGSFAAAKLAVADFNAAAKGMKVELISADHLNKPDLGSSIANSWFDIDKVDVIVDVPNSGIALAVSEIAREEGFLESLDVACHRLQLGLDTEKQRPPALLAEPLGLGV